MIASFPRTTVPLSNRVLLLAFGLAAVAGVLVAFGRLPLPVLVTPVGIVAAIAIFRVPELGVALLPVVGALVPFTLSTGSHSPLVAALLLAAALLGLGVLRAVRADWSPGAAVTLPVIALMLIWVFTLLWSNVELDPLVTTWASYPMVQLGGAGVVVISGGVLLLSMSAGRRGPWIQIATWGLLGSSAVALVAYLIGGQNEVSWPFETGGLFTMWVVSLAFGQALFNQRLPTLARISFLAFAIAWEVKAAYFQTWWFSGWLPGLITLIVVLFLRSRRAFAVVAAIAAVVVGLKFDVLYNVVWGTTVDKGDLSRLDIWQQSLDLFAQHPFLGTGPAGYAVYFQSLYAGSSYSMSTHNNYMDVLLETGIFGTAIFAWFLITMLIVGWRARSRWRSGFHGAFAQSAFAGLIALIAAMGLGDWFIPFVYNQTIAGFRFTVHSWVFLGFLASLAFMRTPTEDELGATGRSAPVRAGQPMAFPGSTQS